MHKCIIMFKTCYVFLCFMPMGIYTVTHTLMHSIYTSTQGPCGTVSMCASMYIMQAVYV